MHQALSSVTSQRGIPHGTRDRSADWRTLHDNRLLPMSYATARNFDPRATLSRGTLDHPYMEHHPTSRTRGPIQRYTLSLAQLKSLAMSADTEVYRDRTCLV